MAELADLDEWGEEQAIGRKTYRPRKIGPRQIMMLEKWMAEIDPDPRVAARAAMEGLPAEVQIHIWDQAAAAAEHWPPKMNNPRGTALLNTAEGIVRMVHATLLPSIPGLTVEQAWAIADEMDMAAVASYIRAIMPRKADPGPKPRRPDPKKAKAKAKPRARDRSRSTGQT